MPKSTPTGWPKIWPGLLVLLLALGCRSPHLPPTPSIAPHPTLLPSPQASPRPLPSPSPTASPTPTPSPTRPPSPSPTPSPTPIARLCSPLPIPPEQWRIYRSRGLTPPPPDNPDGGHQGVDFTYWEGAYGNFVALPVQAVFPGEVVGIERGRYPYGNAVMIATRAEALAPEWRALLGLKPGEALYALYAHLAAAPTFTLGKPVPCGATLGRMGCSGNCGNPHLHLEFRRGPAGETFPQGWTFLSREGTVASDAAYRRWRFEGPFTLLDPWAILTAAQSHGWLQTAP